MADIKSKPNIDENIYLPFINIKPDLYGLYHSYLWDRAFGCRGGMLSTLDITLATDAYGPIADNAGGNVEMSGLVEEVHRQFREVKGILEGKATPDYARCVEISTRGAQREMLLPSLNILIKLMSMVSIVMAGLTVAHHLF